MNDVPGNVATGHDALGHGAPGSDDEAELFAWVAGVCGGTVRVGARSAGGNRARSWSLDVECPDGTTAELFLRYAPPRPAGAEPYTTHREAQVYRAIAGLDLLAPRLVAAHPRMQAILTTRARGIAEFRRLRDDDARQRIAGEVMVQLARLHAAPVGDVALDGGGHGARIRDHVRAELDTWRAMYEEAGRPDPLLDLAFRWLAENMPDPDGPVVLVHGDAGPGNFLFEHGRLTALIDWELAHLGDPMEDLAWFSMRCVMEPVPDFAAAVRAYEQAAGQPIDRARVLYHRVLVSTRVVVIRHRNVTGEFAHAIVSRALNRRLLVETLAAASGTTLRWPAPIEAPAGERDAMFAAVIADLRDVVVARSTDAQVLSRAKAAAKVLKYLQAWDRLGAAVGREEARALAALPHAPPGAGDSDDAPPALARAVRDGALGFAPALQLLAEAAAREAQLAAGASGGIAARHHPDLPPHPQERAP